MVQKNHLERHFRYPLMECLRTFHIIYRTHTIKFHSKGGGGVNNLEFLGDISLRIREKM